MREPLVPVIVTLYVPAGVLELVVRVSADVPEPITVDGANAYVVDGGSPDADSVTIPENPPRAVTVVVYVAAAPGETVRRTGVAVTLKPGAVTLSVDAAVRI